MPANYDKLKGLLRELFQMDQADLDFGIFRIMNAKRDEIDSNRVASPLAMADDAVLVDSTYMTLEEVIDRIVDLVESS